MGNKYETEPCEPDDPNRCQRNHPTRGQCTNRALEGSTYCAAHGGNKAVNVATKKSLERYKIEKFQATIDQVAEGESKSLADEIILLRLLIQERFNGIDTANDLILQTGPISNLISKVESIIQSAHKLEKSMGEHLSKTQLSTFAQCVVKAVTDELGDLPDAKERISRIVTQIQEAMNNGE